MQQPNARNGQAHVNSQNPVCVNIVTALHAEAKPIIALYRLKKMMNSQLPVFVNKENTLRVVISGIGKINAAIATTYISSLFNSHRQNNHDLSNHSPRFDNHSTSIFLNIGMAGSCEFSIGQLILANKLQEVSTHRSWYPFITHLRQYRQSVLYTHDHAQSEYPNNGLVDMEGSAFFQAALRFVSLEHIHVLKIISDNNDLTRKQLNEDTAKQLITQNLEEIEVIIQKIKTNVQSETALMDEKLLQKFIAKWHFTCSQQLQLKEYLRRWQHSEKDKDPYIKCLYEKNSQAVLSLLKDELNLDASLA